MKDGAIHFRSFAGLTLLFLGVFVSTVGSLGKKLTMIDPEPVMSMAQGVAMPGGIMARLDLFLIAFWIVGVFCVFSGYLFYGNESIKHAFSKKDYRNYKKEFVHMMDDVYHQESGNPLYW